MPASTSFADRHYQPGTDNRRAAASRDREPPPGPYEATRSAGPFLEAMGELDEQEGLL